MYKIFLEDSGTDLRYFVEAEAQYSRFLLTFTTQRNASDLLRLLQFLREADDEEDLFVLAEKLLPAHLHYMLFYLYLQAKAARVEVPFDPGSFLRLLRQKTSGFAGLLHRMTTADRAFYTMNLQLQVVPSEHGFGIRCLIIRNVEDYISSLSLYLLQHEQKLKHCEVCGAYFLQERYQQGRLCAYSHREGLSCTEKRCRQNALDTLTADPLLMRCKKIYKRNYMRCERRLNASIRHRASTPGEDPHFQMWSRDITKLRKDYVEELISGAEFSRGLSLLEAQADGGHLYETAGLVNEQSR
ncbi:MAG: hypothetical protein EOM03_04205 [Clostridia bacterium]|nr:hypothetical protein [Clostridia bacterium]